MAGGQSFFVSSIRLTPQSHSLSTIHMSVEQARARQRIFYLVENLVHLNGLGVVLPARQPMGPKRRKRRSGSPLSDNAHTRACEGTTQSICELVRRATKAPAFRHVVKYNEAGLNHQSCSNGVGSEIKLGRDASSFEVHQAAKGPAPPAAMLVRVADVTVPASGYTAPSDLITETSATTSANAMRAYSAAADRMTTFLRVRIGFLRRWR
jgi:FAD/FMN-containing dehydrogenase